MSVTPPMLFGFCSKPPSGLLVSLPQHAYIGWVQFWCMMCYLVCADGVLLQELFLYAHSVLYELCPYVLNVDLQPAWCVQV